MIPGKKVFGRVESNEIIALPADENGESELFTVSFQDGHVCSEERPFGFASG